MKLYSFNNILLGVLLLLNCTLIYKYFQVNQSEKYTIEINEARNKIYKAAMIRISKNISLLPLTNTLDSNFTKQLQKSDFTLLVLFEPNQCGACLEEKFLWNSLSDNKTIPVIGITYLKNKTELTQYLNDSKTTIPIYQDTTAFIGKSILPEGVPVKLLVNRNHEIILMDYVRKTEAERSDFTNLLKYYLKIAKS